jgi:hypothetical protein
MDETEAAHYYYISARCVVLRTEQRTICKTFEFQTTASHALTRRYGGIQIHCHCFLMNIVNNVLLLLLPPPPPPPPPPGLDRLFIVHYSIDRLFTNWL